MAVVASLVAMVLVSAAGAAQEAVEPPDSAAVEVPDCPAVVAHGVTPRGAMVRAFLLPGWGHASIGSYNRGAFYFIAEGGSFFMTAKSARRLAEARARIRLRENTLTAELAEDGITDPEEIQEALDTDPALEELRGLEESRSRQREDWLALGLFLVLISGVDAYVSAHLQDFPTPIEIRAEPVGQGRFEIGARVRLPN